MKIRKRIVIIVGFVLQIIITNIAFAQSLGTPCNGGDPDVDCPVDNWILLFAAFVIVYAGIKIKHIKTVAC